LRKALKETCDKIKNLTNALVTEYKQTILISQSETKNNSFISNTKEVLLVSLNNLKAIIKKCIGLTSLEITIYTQELAQKTASMLQILKMILLQQTYDTESIQKLQNAIEQVEVTLEKLYHALLEINSGFSQQVEGLYKIAYELDSEFIENDGQQSILDRKKKLN